MMSMRLFWDGRKQACKPSQARNTHLLEGLWG